MDDSLSANSLRQVYWAFANHLSRIRHMLTGQRRHFGREVLRSHIRFAARRIRPNPHRPASAADAAAAWLLKAQSATPDDGVSHGYFPVHWEMGWRPSYPETTGYIIPSLFEYSRTRELPEFRDRALDMASWESEIQMSTGAVQGGPVCPPVEQRPAVFNTGMVLQGWTAAWRESGDPKFLQSARKAADFLLGDMDSEGHFQTHGGFVTQHKIKTYNVLCAWGLYRFGEDTGESAYKDAAVRNGEAVVSLQRENGWFPHCCLSDPNAPLTHTIGYTLQGLLEVGQLAGRKDFIAAVQRGIHPLIAATRENGYLAGRFDAHWKQRGRFSCLTGSAQVAIVLYRLWQLTGEPIYAEAADRLVDFLRAIQCLDSSDTNINGALPGSFPILGPYMTAGYPNWATKYFLDALLLQEQRHGVR